MEFKFFLGCDVSKDSFNYCLQTSMGILDQGQVANSTKGIQGWLSKLKKQYKQELNLFIICMEYTGIYNSILLRMLHKEQLYTCIEGAMNIKLSLGLQRGKNDKVDAQRIAEYAMRYTDRLKQWKPKREVVEKLQYLMSARERLVKAKKVLTGSNQDASLFLEKSKAKLIRNSAQGALKAIDKDIKQLEVEIKELIQGDENLHRLTELSTSVPGIGLITSCTLIVRTNEYQDYANAKKVACTAGVAPFEHSSGSSIRGKTRVSHQAHKGLKTALHLAAMGAIRTEGDFQDFYTRKVSEGKNKMSVLNAVRNKLIHRVFALVRDNTMYQKNYQYSLG